MKLRLLILIIVIFAIPLGGCWFQDQKNGNENLKPSVVYGDDDRLDLIDVQDEATLQYARSTALLVKDGQIEKVSELEYQLNVEHYGTSYNLCQEEPFREQSLGGFCSGFLVDRDLLITAGHCVSSQRACEQMKFVFDFAIHSETDFPGPERFHKEQVYSCDELLDQKVEFSGADYAVIQLDRPVVGRTPLRVRPPGAIERGQRLFVIGHPAGLPTKVAGGAQVRSVDDDYFVANLDTYGGNSGSAVFNQDEGWVEGILVRGEVDYVERGGCYVSNQCEDDSCRGEDVTDIQALPLFSQ